MEMSDAHLKVKYSLLVLWRGRERERERLEGKTERERDRGGGGRVGWIACCQTQISQTITGQVDHVIEGE